MVAWPRAIAVAGLRSSEFNPGVAHVHCSFAVPMLRKRVSIAHICLGNWDPGVKGMNGLSKQSAGK